MYYGELLEQNAKRLDKIHVVTTISLHPSVCFYFFSRQFYVVSHKFNARSYIDYSVFEKCVMS